ncbi:MAG: hypothetical protein HRU40_02110 [Saprospiraceae bacterium]|nr:hypothetical protein [Saprospiraceae bacterium]
MKNQLFQTQENIMQRLPLTFLFIAVIGLTFLNTSCQSKQRDVPSITEVNPYVFAYTSGTISRTAPIRIELSGPVATPDQVGEVISKKWLQITPNVSGTLTWADQQTLFFQPDAPLSSSTTFSASLSLKGLFPEVQGEQATFAFAFRTRDQFMQVNLDGLRAPQLNDLSKQVLDGTVFTADQAESEAVEKCITARQDNRTLTITWDHSADGREHNFSITEIQRTEKSSEVAVQWNAKPIGSTANGKKEITIAPIGEFTLLSAEVLATDGQHLSLQFSDPVDPSQNLSGLIEIYGYTDNLRFLTDNNTVKVFPTQSLAGTKNVIVSQNVKNIAGKSLGLDARRTVEFAEIRPQVRLVGNGVIMPETNGLLFPFEAIGLKKVYVEIFKVYSNNVLQFLQSNELNTNSNLRQVGRISYSESIELQVINPTADATQWSRYALDLASLIEQDDQAIYAVRIGFMPEHAISACAAEKVANIAFQSDYGYYGNDIDPNNQRSIMDSWYGVRGYYNDYSWENRDDPCYPEYYNADRFVQRNVIASNLGIIAKRGKSDDVLAVITDLRTGRPVSGAQVTAYDYQQQSVGTGTTNSKGITSFKVSRNPFVLLVTGEGERGYVRLTSNEALAMSRFNVNGQETKKGLKGFIYGERGVWRPGDSIFLQFILDDQDNPLPENYPIQFEVTNARGQRHLERTIVNHTGKVYPLHFSTDPESPTGNWRAIVRAGEASFEKTLRIETVKPNRLAIELDLGTEQVIGRQPMTINLQSKWLHGAPASNLKARVEAQLLPVPTRFDSYASYTFDDPARKYVSTDSRVLFDNTLNREGGAQFLWNLPTDNSAPGLMRAALRTRVFERGGDFSMDSYSVSYSPYQVYAGVNIPKNQYQEPRLEINQEGSLGIVTVDPKGRPVGNRSVTARIYQVDWRWWWDDGYDNMSRFNTASNYRPLASTRLVTNAQGEASWSLTPSEWGRYFVRICDEESGHCTGDFLYAGYPWYDNNNATERQQAAMLTFQSDQEKYTVGERVESSIPPGQSGSALVSLENGSGVLETFWADPTSDGSKISFKTTPEMSPTVYAHITMIQPHQQQQNNLPIRMYGVLPITVDDPSTFLAPELKMPDELKPEETFTLEVKETNGQPMSYTVAIVDEGLLGLTRFQTPDPHRHFYAKEALGVRTWDVYDQVLGASGSDLSSILTVGGDAAAEAENMEPTANRFKPVVIHLGPFALGKGKKQKHTITLPNYVGAVRAMVVGRSGAAYGHTDKRVSVTNPLMVLGTLPRVLTPGEKLTIPVSVFVNDPRLKNVQIKVTETSGLLQLDNNGSEQLSFQEAGSKLAYISATVGESSGIAKVSISATSGREQANQEIEIAIRNPNPYQSSSIATVLDGGESWRPDFTPIGTASTQKAYLEVSNLPPLNLGERLNSLLRYPYGCVEQTISTAFPQLYASQLINMRDDQKATIPTNIQGAIQRLVTFQTSDGGLAYWPGGSRANDWGTSYAGHFLAAAQEKGYRIPPALLNGWTRYQKQASRNWNPLSTDRSPFARRQNQLTQAYRLYTLALTGSPDLSAMNQMRETDNLSAAARWRLAADYAIIGPKNVATELVDNLPIAVDDYRELSYTYGSTLRDQAMLLEALLLLERDDQAGTILQDISKRMSSQQWLSTQEVAFALMAAAKFVGDSEVTNTFRFTYAMNSSSRQDAGSQLAVMQIDLSDQLRTQTNQLQVKNEGNNRLFARIILEGQPLPGNETGQTNDLGMQVKFMNLDGSTIMPTAIPQGQDFIAEVRITHTGQRANSYEELALDMVFPSGWEIINSRMDDLSGTTQSTFEYQDVRDDRVNTFFDLNRGRSKTYRVQLNAAYLGRFYLPGTSCTAMYDNSISAYQAGQWIEVVPAENEL